MDTTLNVGSLALLEDETILAETSWENASSHTAILPLQFRKILKQTKTTLDEIDLFAVAKGPGSFTGIRIGIGFVKGLTLLNAKPVFGISTLEAMSLTCPTSLTCPILNARRGQIFAAAYHFQGEQLRQFIAEGAYDPRDFFEQVKKVAEEKSYTPFFWGSGLKVYSKELHQVFGDKAFKEEEFFIPLAKFVALGALKAKQRGVLPVTSFTLEPSYLRGAAADSKL